MIGGDEHLEAYLALSALHAPPAAPDAGIPASRIVAYARRADTTADLALERLLRRAPGARALHAAALAGVARASSLAVAAAADRVTARRVGAWQLEIREEPGGLPWLVIHAPADAPPIRMIELRRPDGAGRRLDLGAPVDRVFQLPLDPGFAELAGLYDWLQDPATAIHLL